MTHKSDKSRTNKSDELDHFKVHPRLCFQSIKKANCSYRFQCSGFPRRNSGPNCLYQNIQNIRLADEFKRHNKCHSSGSSACHKLICWLPALFVLTRACDIQTTRLYFDFAEPLAVRESSRVETRSMGPDLIGKFGPWRSVPVSKQLNSKASVLFQKRIATEFCLSGSLPESPEPHVPLVQVSLRNQTKSRQATSWNSSQSYILK